MIINIDKEDTQRLIFESIKQQNFENRFNFSTRYPWKCLKCLEPIYISYKESANNAIFCNLHKHETLRKTQEEKFVQGQYMRIVKDRQLNLIQSFFDSIEI